MKRATVVHVCSEFLCLVHVSLAAIPIVRSGSGIYTLLLFRENPNLAFGDLHADGWQNNVIQNTQRAWQSAANEEPGYEFVMRSALSDAIFALISNASAHTSIVPQKVLLTNERMKCMIRYIQEH